MTGLLTIGLSRDGLHCAGIALALSWALVTGGVHAAADAAVISRAPSGAYEYGRPPGVEIRVLDRGWGNARAADIESVLYSVAGILLEHFPGRRLDPIVVSHSPERPITLY